MRFFGIRATALAAACVLLSPAAVPAQVTTATLYGIVRDSSQSLLPGATVTLVHEGTDVSRTTQTDAAGEFGFPALPVGAYALTIELQGFKTHVSRGLQLGSGQAARQTFTLEVGALAESVIVEGETPLVKTASSEQMETLGRLQVTELPLARRNITGCCASRPASIRAAGTGACGSTAWASMAPASPSTGPTPTPIPRGAAFRSTAARTTSTS